jgi:hypothetical protein
LNERRSCRDACDQPSTLDEVPTFHVFCHRSLQGFALPQIRRAGASRLRRAMGASSSRRHERNVKWDRNGG